MSNPNDTPKIMTLEEMEAALNSIKKASSSPKKSRSKKTPPPKQPSVAAKATPEIPQQQCYLDMHFWLRDGDLFGTVCNDAKDEKSYRGPGVSVFAHDHARINPCSDKCKEIK